MFFPIFSTISNLSSGRIGTLKYLEIEIEKWSSGAKWGQMEPNGIKRGQTRPNRAKQGQTRPNENKRSQEGAKMAKWGQTGLIFCMHAYFYEIKNHVLQPRPSDKNWPSYGNFVDSKILIGLH